MMTRTCLRWLITLVLLASAGVSAQSFSITKSAIGGAGGQALSADNGVRGTLGQPFSGITR
nr:hypothetical protein [Calditrichia bacterium]